MCLVLSFLLVLLVAATVNAQTTDCQSDYGSLADAIKAIDKGALPTAQFNPTCLKMGCPDLEKIPCPFNAGTTVHNTTAVDILVEATIQCVRNVETLCGVPIPTIPICPAGVSLQTLLNTQDVEGTINIMPETGAITGIPWALITYDGGTQNGVINVTANISGQFEGTLGQLQFSNIPFNVSAAMAITIHVNSTNTDKPVTIVGITGAPTFFFGDFFPGNTDDSVTKFNKALAALPQQPLVTSFPSDVGLFWGYIFNSVCLLSQDNCPKSVENSETG